MPESIISHLQSKQAYIPESFLSPGLVLIGLSIITLAIAFRYFVAVGPFYYSFWKLGLGKNLKRLHHLNPPRGQIRFEIKWSLVSSVIFAASAILMGLFWEFGISKLYTSFSAYPIWWMPVSFLILAIIHEFYFYWTHVWMHFPKLYSKVHAVHHKSVKTSPWASFSFHPWEAIVHAIFLPICVLIIPIHPLVIIAYLIFMTVTAISNHLGVELISSPLIKSFFISGTHHYGHHRNMKKNFGLYFTFSDKLFGTEEKNLE